MVNIFNVLFGCFISPSFSVSNASKASRWCVFRQCLYVSCSLMYSPCSELYNPLPSTSYRFSASISSLICPKLESQPLLQLYFPCFKSCHWFLSEIFAQKKITVKECLHKWPLHFCLFWEYGYRILYKEDRIFWQVCFLQFFLFLSRIKILYLNIEKTFWNHE